MKTKAVRVRAPMTPEQRAAKAIYDRARYARKKAEREALRPPDPIETLTAEERAYLAGLIDGEGSIFVAAVGPQRHRSVYPMVVVAMTHLGVISWMAERLQAGTVKRHGGKGRPSHHKQQWRTGLFGKRAKLLCATLLPYLRVKSEQARLVSEFPADARIAPGVKIDHAEINTIRYRLRDQINALNH